MNVLAMQEPCVYGGHSPKEAKRNEQPSTKGAEALRLEKRHQCYTRSHCACAAAHECQPFHFAIHLLSTQRQAGAEELASKASEQAMGPLVTDDQPTRVAIDSASQAVHQQLCCEKLQLACHIPSGCKAMLHGMSPSTVFVQKD